MRGGDTVLLIALFASVWVITLFDDELRANDKEELLSAINNLELIDEAQEPSFNEFLRAWNDETNNSGVHGSYYPQGAIVIHTSRNNIQAINNTIHHEYLHYLIDHDVLIGRDSSAREHFCGGVIA